MRSDEQRDECIDMLLVRIQALEAEVARMKGEQFSSDGVTTNQIEKVDKSEEDALPKSNIMQILSKTADASLENIIGTRWIGRIGLLAILFGVAFFLKYSFDNKLIGEMGRVILGIFWGTAFIGAGEYFQKKGLGFYGQTLSGGGLAVFYLSLYAAFALYHLIPLYLATIAMLAVTTTGMTLSVRYSAYTLAAIALLGGFLTPVMLSSSINQPLTLFGYILLLDAGTILIQRFRQWSSLIAASLFGTVLLYIGWHMEFFNDEQHWLAIGVIIAFFALYNFYILISHLFSKHVESRIDQFIIFGSASFFFLAFFSQYHWESVWPVKTFTIVLAGFEIGMAEFIRRREHETRMTMASFAAVSLIMTVIAIFVALEQRWIMPALAAEMSALGWIGLRLRLPVLRQGAYLLALVVLVRFAFDVNLRLEPFERFIPLFNSRFLVCISTVAAFYALMKFIWEDRESLTAGERYVPDIVFVTTQALSLVLLSIEVHDFFRFRSPGHILDWAASRYALQLSLSVLWALYASILIGIGILKRFRGARMVGILLLGVTVLKVFLIDLSHLQTFYRIISFIMLGLLLLAVSYGYNRFKHFIFGEDL